MKYFVEDNGKDKYF